MKLAILGGTFNPPHLGHLSIASAAHDSGGYDTVLLVPAHQPPHKEYAGGASAEDRLAMLSLLTVGHSWLHVDDCELRRGGVSWTIDTVEDLYRRYRGRIDGRIGVIIGQDLAEEFHTWKEYRKLLDCVDIVLLSRPGCSPVVPAFAHNRLEMPGVDISSSMIRDAVKTHKTWSTLVPAAIYDYILEHGLYDK